MPYYTLVEQAPHLLASPLAVCCTLAMPRCGTFAGPPSCHFAARNSRLSFKAPPTEDVLLVPQHTDCPGSRRGDNATQ